MEGVTPCISLLTKYPLTDSFFATATADSYLHEKYMPFMTAIWNIPATARIGSRSRAREDSIAARMALYAANDREKTGTAANTAISAAK